MEHTRGDDHEHPAAYNDGPVSRRASRGSGAHRDLLPEATADDAEMVAPTPDEWLRRERPPHHD